MFAVVRIMIDCHNTVWALAFHYEFRKFWRLADLEFALRLITTLKYCRSCLTLSLLEIELSKMFCFLSPEVQKNKKFFMSNGKSYYLLLFCVVKHTIWSRTFIDVTRKHNCDLLSILNSKTFKIYALIDIIIWLDNYF